MTRNAFEEARRQAAEIFAEARAKRALERQAREVRETVETLVEDRGRVNALAWAEHCMVRDPVGGFWRQVADAIREGGR